jgi:hypothetical protein
MEENFVIKTSAVPGDKFPYSCTKHRCYCDSPTCRYCHPQRKITRSERERDALWCRALVATLSTEDIERVTKEFNRIRPDK